MDDATPSTTVPILSASGRTVTLEMDLPISASNALSVKVHRCSASSLAASSWQCLEKADSSSS